MPTPHRILDANANRAREALWVMEDGARFLLNDEALTHALKAEPGGEKPQVYIPW